MIVGITGRARSGKDTAAGILAGLCGITELAFADPLKEAAICMFGISRDMAYGINYNREQIVEPWGISVREMLQKLGTECARHVFRDDFWMVRADIELDREPMYAGGFILTDIRFDNEAQWVRDKGGKVIKMSRQVGGIDEEHSSEHGISASLVDYFIPNNGTLQHLRGMLIGVVDG